MCAYTCDKNDTNENASLIFVLYWIFKIFAYFFKQRKQNKRKKISVTQFEIFGNALKMRKTNIECIVFVKIFSKKKGHFINLLAVFITHIYLDNLRRWAQLYGICVSFSFIRQVLICWYARKMFHRSLDKNEPIWQVENDQYY